MKRMVFIGGLIDTENLHNFLNVSTCSSSLAQENYFLRLARSFKSKGYLVNSISSPFLGVYSKHTQQKYNDCFNDRDGFYYGKCPTKPIPRLFNLERSLWKAYKKMAYNEKILEDDEIVLFVIQPNYFYLHFAIRLQKKHPNSKIVTFVQDIPYYSHSEKHSFITSFLKNIEKKRISKILNKSDGFILFAKGMEEKLSILKPSIVMETVLPCNIPEPSFEKRIPSSVAYTGSLNEIYGVKKLIKEFIESDTDLSLYLVGDGDCKEYIQGLNNPKIIYKGTLSLEECAELQSKMSVLVNPREPIADFTEYSFPSKTTEYLLNNGVVACFKLGGIPNEYDNVLNYANGNSFSSLLDLVFKLSKISKAQFEDIIKKRNKLLLNKTEDEQTSRIIKFLEEF